jgi:uncharacterized Zn finger protein (UPF0148 family)
MYNCVNLNCGWAGIGKKGDVCPECHRRLIDVSTREELRKINFQKKTLRKSQEYLKKGNEKKAKELEIEQKAKMEKIEEEKRKKIEEKRKKDQQKKKLEEQKRVQNEKNRISQLLFHETMGDDLLIRTIEFDMNNLARHEAGTGWMRLGTLLSFNSTEQMIGAGFKAIIDQNKVLIKQNELLYRQNKLINAQLEKLNNQFKDIGE